MPWENWYCWRRMNLVLESHPEIFPTSANAFLHLPTVSRSYLSSCFAGAFSNQPFLLFNSDGSMSRKTGINSSRFFEARSTISESSSKHQREVAYPSVSTTTANRDSSIAFTSSFQMEPPLGSSLSSWKALIPSLVRAS